MFRSLYSKAIALFKRVLKKYLSTQLLQARICLKESKFNSIILERLSLPVTAVEDLAKDISMDYLPSRELHAANYFYGFGDLLRQYAGMPPQYILKVAYSHIFYGRPWSGDIDSNLPVLLVWGEAMQKAFEACTSKPVISIGPPIHYAVNMYNDEGVLLEKKRLGKNALVFPSHSTHNVRVVYPYEFLLGKAANLQSRYDTVRFCLYWKDILSGDARPFLESGYECVTAGHMFDQMFYSRLKGLLSIADHTYSNFIGTQAGLSTGLNIPHTIFPQKIMFEGNVYYKDGDEYFNEIVSMSEAFYSDECAVNAKQKMLADHFFGFSCVKTREELRKILIDSEEMYILEKKNAGQN